MKDYRFEGSVSGSAGVAENVERAYRIESGVVRVRVEWPSTVHVVDESGTLDARDIPAFVELFFHDVFLLFNIASPGSFGGVIRFAGGEYRVNELRLDARLFQYARARIGAIETLPLRDVVAWLDALQLGTEQLATTDVAKVLFHLLHLSRGEESEWASILRLGQSLEVLLDAADDDDSLRHFFALRDAIVRGTAPVIHPMHDDALDARVDDASIELVEAVDFAAGMVVRTLQARVRSMSAT